MVSFADFNRRGTHNWILRDLGGARRAANAIERGVSGPRMIAGITPQGHILGDKTEVLFAIRENLLESDRLYRQGNVVMFTGDGDQSGQDVSVRPLAVDGAVTPIASARLGNVVYCEAMKANTEGKGAKVDQPLEYPVQYPVPQSVLQQVFVMDSFMAEIPEARFITKNPVFNEDFALLDVGYHERERILVCGDSFEPVEWVPCLCPLLEPPTIADVLDRLPPRVRRWVEGFHWKSAVDLINYVGSAFMILLMPMLIEDGHPGVMFGGNQPMIGKTLSAQCLALLKDGEQASPTALDEGSREVENQIASELNDARTVLLFDNLRGALDCPILEANMTAPVIGIRAFKLHTKMRRPNDVLWLLTTNDIRSVEDLLSRYVHVELRYEGLPDTHRFSLSQSELVAYVRNNRTAILAELAGMVLAWRDAGRPEAAASSRFKVFGRVVGSVLTFNGLPGFLSNTREVVCANSQSQQQLIALIERLIDSRPADFIFECQGDLESADDAFKQGAPPARPMEKGEWVHLLIAAGAIPSSCDTPQKQKTAATKYLNGVVKKPVDIDVGGAPVRAMIVSRSLGARRTAYMLAVAGLSASPRPDGAGTCDPIARDACQGGVEAVVVDVPPDGDLTQAAAVARCERPAGEVGGEGLWE